MALKTYLSDKGGMLPSNLWKYDAVGHTDEASKELKALFGGRAVFQNPKPTRLIRRVLEIACPPDGIVLDSFAGSGTTGQAVLMENQAKGAHRRFILVEMGDYADTITAQRIRTAISGGNDIGSVRIDSGFSYYELGPALFDEDGMLNPAVGIEDVRRYVWHTETKAPYRDRTSEHPYLLGEVDDTVYYLAYEPGSETVLAHELLRSLPIKRTTTVVFADRCLIADEALERLGIRYRQIPRQIARM